jgi:hypothetical protein
MSSSRKRPVSAKLLWFALLVPLTGRSRPRLPAANVSAAAELFAAGSYWFSTTLSPT